MAYKVNFKLIGKDLSNMIEKFTSFKEQKRLADEAADAWQKAAREKAPNKTGKLRSGIKRRSPKYKLNNKKAEWIFELYFSSRGKPPVSAYGESIEKGLTHSRPSLPYLIPVNEMKGKNITAREFITKPRLGFTGTRYKKDVGVIGFKKGDKRTRGKRRMNQARLLFREVKEFSHKPTRFITDTKEVPINYMKNLFKEMRK